MDLLPHLAWLLSQESMFNYSDEYDNNIMQQNVVKNVENQHVLNERTDLMVKIIDLPRVLNRT